MKPNVNLALIFALGCTEPTTAPSADTLLHSDGGTSHLVTEGDAPEGVPPEYNLPTKLYSVEADAGYVDQYGYAGTIVHYFATNALAKATVITGAGSSTGEEQTSQLLPWDNYLGATTNFYMGLCSGSIRAEAYGAVWNEFPLFSRIARWGDKSKSDSHTFFCPSPIPPDDGSDGGGGGGGGDGSCYVVYIDHYWYSPDTGDVEYRYTESVKVCEYET